jgi:hypothetical protein
MCASAKPTLPAQQRAVEGGGVDLEHRAQRLGPDRARRSARRAVALAQLEHAPAREAQEAVHEGAGQAVGHRGASRGWPK